MSAIKPGDLVMVVKPTPCCGNTRAIGMTFTVSLVADPFDGVCLHCLQGDTAPCVRAVGMYGWIERSRLKRIDPLPAEDDIEHREEIEA